MQGNGSRACVRLLSITARIVFAVLILQMALTFTRIAHADAANGSLLNGFWVTPDGDWVVEITPCVGGFCGHLVGLRKSARPNALRVDIHNQDPALRGRPLCGLTLMGGFTQTVYDAQRWSGGWVYDPENGKTYSGEMWLAGPDTLKLRGYVFLPLFGRSETLTRETGPINRCSAIPGG
jgi:uncharacterized protein (DUF2147 family)